VVSLCTATFAGLANWAGIQLFGISCNSSLPFSIAPFMPFSRGVSTISAPSAFMILRLSIDIDSGIVSISL
jgi:hypothetical protein